LTCEVEKKKIQARKNGKHVEKGKPRSESSKEMKRNAVNKNLSPVLEGESSTGDLKFSSKLGKIL